MSKVKIQVQCSKKPPRRHLKFIVGPIREQTSIVRPTPQMRGGPLRRSHVSITMSDSQSTTLTIEAQDKKNQPTTLPAGDIAWMVDNTSMLSLTPAADGMSCQVDAAGPLGRATISVKVTAPDATTLAAGSEEFIITAGAAAKLTLTSSPPVEQP